MESKYWHIVVLGTFSQDEVEALLENLEMTIQSWRILDSPERHMHHFSGFAKKHIDYENFHENFMKVSGVIGVLFTDHKVQLSVVPEEVGSVHYV